MTGFRSRGAMGAPAAALSVLLTLGTFATPASAFVMDMEGFAPPGDSTSELDFDPPNYSVSQQGSFTLNVAHGHYYSATHVNT